MTEISIIMPVYNVGKYLRECLDSIVNQSFKDFEIICINDGSTDNSLKILEEYRDKDSRFTIISQDNTGAGEARNTGLKYASGKYVQFLDSDDYFEPNMLENLYKTAKKYNADLTVCSAAKIDENGNSIEYAPINLHLCPIEIPFSVENFPKNIFSLFTPAPWNKLILKDLIVSNDLKFQNLSSSNDYAFTRILTVCAKNIVVINEKLVTYRYNRVGSIASKRASEITNLLKAGECIKNFLVKNGLYELLEEAFISSIKSSISWEISHCNDRQYKKFIMELKKILPDDWKIFRPVLRKEYITPKYIRDFIGNKKIMLWGASLFLEDVLKSETEKNPNILGIIDKNPAKWGKFIGSYEIFPPESLNALKPDGVLLTVHSNYETIYPALQKELKENCPEIELLPNIFEAEEE